MGRYLDLIQKKNNVNANDFYNYFSHEEPTEENLLKLLDIINDRNLWGEYEQAALKIHDNNGEAFANELFALEQSYKLTKNRNEWFENLLIPENLLAFLITSSCMDIVLFARIAWELGRVNEFYDALNKTDKLINELAAVYAKEENSEAVLSVKSLISDLKNLMDSVVELEDKNKKEKRLYRFLGLG